MEMGRAVQRQGEEHHHEQWWQGKFTLQRSLVCPGCSHFLDKPTWIFLSTTWMKAMDNHS